MALPNGEYDVCIIFVSPIDIGIIPKMVVVDVIQMVRKRRFPASIRGSLSAHNRVTRSISTMPLFTTTPNNNNHTDRGYYIKECSD